MIPSKGFGNWQLLASSVIVGGAVAFSDSSTKAQIVPDTTLGAESSVITPQAPDSPIDVIQGGATRGANLFHSFEQFSVPTGGTAYFNNALNTQNIFSRVTGASISNIDGLIQANASANLFLLNPNGIIFGPHAALNIGGSFLGSTASSLNFADGNQFSATNPQSSSLLTMSVPVGLQFGPTPGAIIVQARPNTALDSEAPLSNWSNDGQDSGTYTINLTGTSINSATEVGDAGQLPSTAQSVDNQPVNTEPSSISGTLSNDSDVDLFQVFLTGEQIFSATTVGQSDVDTQLFLFDASGFAVDSNDDSGGTAQSTLPANTSLTPNQSGLYYLGISSYNNDPINPEFKVQPGRTLALVGGDLQLNGSRLQVPSGRVELGGVARAGTVGLNVDSNNLALSFPGDVARADVLLTNGSIVDVAAGGGGSIAINARNLDVLERSILLVGLAPGLGFVNTQAGDITLNATEAIQVDQSLIGNIVFFGTTGNAGDIRISTGSLSLTTGAQLDDSTFGRGNAGNVIIDAGDNISLDDSTIFSSVIEDAEGRSGSINITTGSLSLTNGAQLDASNLGRGSSGNIIISAQNSVSLDGASPDGERASTFFTEVVAGAEGDGGNIEISTGSLFVTNGAVLEASTRGQGNAGNILITARDIVLFDGVRARGPSGAFNTVEQGAFGRGGSIQIVTGSLAVTNEAQLGADTEGQGDAGNIIITARDSVLFTGGSLAIAGVAPGAEGAGGNFVVNTGSLDVRNGAQIVVGTTGRGDAGNVIINARDTVSLDGVGSNGFSSAVASSVESGAVGNGGDINVTAGSLSLTNGAFLSARSAGNGAAGNLKVMADSIHLDNQASLIANTTAGEGNIFLRSRDLVLRRGSKITTNAFGAVTGGNINIDTGVIAALENSDITANAEAAFGGRVNIDAQGIFGTKFRNQPTSESDITASSNLGLQFSGSVEINTSNVDLNQGLVTLPVELVNVEGLIANSCIARSSKQGGNFNITGAGGLPTRPGDAAISPYPTGTVRSILNSAESPSSSQTNSVPSINKAPQWKMGDPIVEPQGVYRLANGELVLSRECSY